MGFCLLVICACRSPTLRYCTPFPRREKECEEGTRSVYSQDGHGQLQRDQTMEGILPFFSICLFELHILFSRIAILAIFFPPAVIVSLPVVLCFVRIQMILYKISPNWATSILLSPTIHPRKRSRILRCCNGSWSAYTIADCFYR